MKRRPYGRDSFVKVFLLMNDRRTNLGFSITEVLVVVAIIAVLVGIGVPAAKQMQKSFESTAGVKNVIGAALGNARAIALKEGKYAGVRFQQDAAGRQYMVLVVYDNQVGEMLPGNIGLRTVKGRKPLPLPENVAVMDMVVKKDYDSGAMGSVNQVVANEKWITSDADIELHGTYGEIRLLDSTTFTILFSPAGKLITHSLRVSHTASAGGDIFNTLGNSIFVEDDKGVVDGRQIEMSRKFFVIVVKNELGKVAVDKRWSEYLVNLEMIYINPYSGEIIK